MNELEARNLHVTHHIVSIMGDEYDAKYPAQIDSNYEPGFIWVLMDGIHDETHYSKWYRLTQYEQVTVVIRDEPDTLGHGDMIHPKLRKAAEDWIRDSFEVNDDIAQILRSPDRWVKLFVNKTWDGGWVDFVRSNTVNGEYV